MNIADRILVRRLDAEAARRRETAKAYLAGFNGGLNESIDFAEARRRRLARQQFWFRLKRARDLRLLRYSFAFFFIAGVLAIWLYQSLR